MANKDLVFSGVQPSASQVHLGNYIGAMKRFVSLSKEVDTIVCVVDLHALTSVSDASLLRENTLSLAAAYVAIGLEPEKTIIFKQSDIPEVCELTWYLSCLFPLGLLERAHSIKDARAKNSSVNSGILYYPILMAADILLYKANKIPVGADQKQHLEMTREVAQKFNATFGDFFPLPEPLIEEGSGLIVGLDGRKMSKSYDNYIGLFESSKKIRKKVMQIVTDSKAVEDKKDPDECSIFSLFKHFSSKEEQADLADRYRAGGMGYGHAKQELYEAIEREIAPMRDRYEDLMQRKDDLKDILQDGATRARVIASENIEKIRELIGTR